VESSGKILRCYQSRFGLEGRKRKLSQAGQDPWVGANGQHLLPQNLIDNLHERGFFHLNQIVDDQQTSIWNQGWQDAQAMNLEEHFIVPWNEYIRALKLIHIRINDQEDELLWQLSPFGVYSPKEGYTFLMSFLHQQVPEWWWKGIWKAKCPLKARVFMWCLLKKKVPTWDRMKLRGLEGPGWCPLCKGEEETSLHLFLDCPFSIQTWRNVSSVLGQPFSWHGTSIEEAWKLWVQNHRYKRFKALPSSSFGEFGLPEILLFSRKKTPFLSLL
jgi:hypothetical protein